MYDIIIIGGGPAGLTAGLYGARDKKKTLVIEKSVEGGQITNTNDVENYPGAPGISGIDLAFTIKDQAEKFGCQIVNDDIVEVDLEGKIKKVKGKFDQYEGKVVIIAGGASPRKIGVPGEEDFQGRGVSYCATCDGAFYEGFEVYVVGGGDAAVEEAIYLTNFAKKVHIIHRRDELRASKDLQAKAFKNEKIDFIWNSQVTELKGDKTLKELYIKNNKSGDIEKITKDEPFGVFVFIGYVPETEIYEGKINMKDGYILTDEEMRTNIDGVFAAGDIRVKTVRQLTTAVGDGTIAAINAYKYIEEQEGTLYEGFNE
ncbi:thioredoxin reductase (NADPH) [Peptoniphilus koenoeneniae]|uniref:Thioredoxin reductase n=1 Tax=Peptoniphilus koenoeneniae TaxID=507751 RepID=A0ABU0AX60_9FIRM|nr:thioredoxin-disulfide reductase [Peptoniphilus koenoeneniae]MDQ0275391.1 thioredoxin reductase (NADPH) [Peptoniphilus koenoeneniae]